MSETVDDWIRRTRRRSEGNNNNNNNNNNSKGKSKFKNRDKTLILACILEQLYNDGAKTANQIQYKNNLSYEYTRIFLRYLKSMKLIDSFGQSYIINERGKGISQTLTEMANMLGR